MLAFAQIFFFSGWEQAKRYKFPSFLSKAQMNFPSIRRRRPFATRREETEYKLSSTKLKIQHVHIFKARLHWERFPKNSENF